MNTYDNESNSDYFKLDEIMIDLLYAGYRPEKKKGPSADEVKASDNAFLASMGIQAL